jgi:hypothetical protein
VIKIILLSITLLLLPFSADAQSRTVRKAEKHKEKVDRQEEKEYNKSKEKAIKQHYKNQSEDTKKQMKQSKKKSRKLDKEKDNGWFETFVKNRKTKKEQSRRSYKQKH